MQSEVTLCSPSYCGCMELVACVSVCVCVSVSVCVYFAVVTVSLCGYNPVNLF